MIWTARCWASSGTDGSGNGPAALGAALGMRVLAYDPVSEPPADVRCADLADLFGRSDVITLHLPLLESTHHLVGPSCSARVKPGTMLVNCGRGGLIDIDAVHAALQDGRLGGVGLDVFDPEPPNHHPLFDHPDVVLTPHLMGLSRQGTAATFTDAAQGVLDVLAGTRPAAVANPGWEKATAADCGDRHEGAAHRQSRPDQRRHPGPGRRRSPAACVREGAAVVISGRNAERGEKVVAELADHRRRSEFRADRRQRRRQAQASVAATIERHGRIDCLVNAAGLTTRGSMLDTTPELFDQHIAVNLRAPFFLMQAAIADMKQRGEPGTIVNVISIDSHGGQSFLAPYVAAKAGSGRFDEERRARPPLGPDPDQRPEHGLVRHRRRGPDPAPRQQTGDLTEPRAGLAGSRPAAKLPMGKLGQVDEIADFVAFLLSDRSGVVTGSVIDWDQNVIGGLG